MRVTEQIHTLLHQTEEIRKNLMSLLHASRNEIDTLQQRMLNLKIENDNLKKDLKTALFRANVTDALRETELKKHG